MNLSILHTNDMHARLDAMARLSAFARRLRAQAEARGDCVLFWDAGDAMDRRVRWVSLSKGSAFSPILNAMGYSLQTMGNDIALTYGPQAMEGITSRAQFPILAANLRDGDRPTVYGLREYELVALSPRVTMGVIGLTAPWDDAYASFGLHMPDFRETTRRLVGQLRGRDISPIVILSHLGLNDDRELAAQVQGIDLIIGAHSHNRLDHGERRHGVLIAQTGQYAEAIGHIELTLDDATGRVLTGTARVLEVPADEAPDPLVLGAIAAAEREVAELGAQPIGDLLMPLDLDYFAECGFGDLTADALRERMDADAALIISGLFSGDLPAGTLTLGQLDAACFTTANPALTIVRGQQVIEALERGLDPERTHFQHPAFRGTTTGIPQISGLNVEYYPDAANGARIKRVWLGDQLLDPARRVRLAHTDAETFEPVGPLRLDEGQASEIQVPTIVREVIEDYVRRHSPVPAPQGARWRAI